MAPPGSITHWDGSVLVIMVVLVESRRGLWAGRGPHETPRQQERGWGVMRDRAGRRSSPAPTPLPSSDCLGSGTALPSQKAPYLARFLGKKNNALASSSQLRPSSASVKGRRRCWEKEAAVGGCRRGWDGSVPGPFPCTFLLNKP